MLVFLFFVPFNEKLSNPVIFHSFRKFLSKFQTHPNQCEFHKTYENPMDFATFNLHDQHGIKCVENRLNEVRQMCCFFFNESEIQPNWGCFFGLQDVPCKFFKNC